MQDTELYQHILGLTSPWEVSKVDLNVKLGEIVVNVSHPKGAKFCCPECSKELGCYDHSPARRWRHLDTCQFKTMLGKDCSRPFPSISWRQIADSPLRYINAQWKSPCFIDGSNFYRLPCCQQSCPLDNTR